MGNNIHTTYKYMLINDKNSIDKYIKFFTPFLIQNARITGVNECRKHYHFERFQRKMV